MNQRLHILMTLLLFPAAIPFFTAFFSSSVSDRTRVLPAIETEPAETRLGIEPIASVQMPGPAVNLTSHGNLVYAPLSFGGLAVLDFADPEAPQLVGHLAGLLGPNNPASRYFLDVLPMDDRLLVSDRNRGYSIYDNRTPEEPALIWIKPIGENVNSVPISTTRVGDWLYLACGGGGLHRLPVKFNQTTPTAPVLAHIDYTRQSVFYPPNYLLVADGYDIGLQVLDISNPESPKLLCQFQTGSFTDSLLVKEPFVILANRSRGFTILDMTDPARPTIANYHYIDPGYNQGIKAMRLWRERYLICGLQTPGQPSPGAIDFYDLGDPRRPRHLLRAPMETQVNTLLVRDDVLIAGLWNSGQLAVFHMKEKAPVTGEP